MPKLRSFCLGLESLPEPEAGGAGIPPTLSSPHTVPLTLPGLAEEARETAAEPGTGLGGKAARGAGGQSHTLAPGRQPGSTVEKRLGTKEASRQAGRLLRPCRSSAEEADLRARLGQVLIWPQEAVEGP